jgi:hypothetical protein
LTELPRREKKKFGPPGDLVINGHLPLAKSSATNYKPSLKSKHKAEYEYEHADHHEMVCLIVMFSRSFLLFRRLE